MRRGRGASAAAGLRRAGFYYWLQAPAALIGPARNGGAGSSAEIGVQHFPVSAQPSSGPAEEPLEFLGVQPVPANHRAIEEQDRDVQPVAPDKLRIGVHIHNIDGRQPDPAPKGFELGQHLIAQIAVLPVHHCQPGLGWPILGWPMLGWPMLGGRAPALVKCRQAQ